MCPVGASGASGEKVATVGVIPSSMTAMIVI